MLSKKVGRSLKEIALTLSESVSPTGRERERKMILRAKSVWCLLLLLAATPIASAQVAGFQAFDAYASGPATAIFDLTPFAGPELHVIDVNIALHRNSPSGAVMDNGATGSIILHDRTRGTDVARMTIDSAFLFDAGGGHQGLIVEGV